MKLNRYQAFGVHLLASAAVALISAAVVFLVWYPSPLQLATGVTGIFLMLLAVDVIVGPCITLIVFNTAKKELKRDLAIVLMLQVAALLYGLDAVFIARPVYVVYNAGRFDLVFANDLSPERLAKATNPLFKSPPLFGPQTISAHRPDDPKLRSKILLNSLSGGGDIAQSPEYYVPYLDERPEILRSVQALDGLRGLNPQSAEQVAALVERYAARKGGAGYLPVKASVKDLVVIVAKDSAEVLEIADLNPW